MAKILIIILCLAALLPAFIYNKHDQFMHFTAGSAIGCAPPPFGVLLAVTAGLGKEYYDMKHEGHTASWGDVMMTIFGALFTTTISWDFWRHLSRIH